MAIHPIDPADIDLPPTQPIDMSVYLRQTLDAGSARAAFGTPR